MWMNVLLACMCIPVGSPGTELGVWVTVNHRVGAGSWTCQSDYCALSYWAMPSAPYMDLAEASPHKNGLKSYSGLDSKDALCKVWWPEFYTWDPRGERRELTSCKLLSPYMNEWINEYILKVITRLEQEAHNCKLYNIKTEGSRVYGCCVTLFLEDMANI